MSSSSKIESSQPTEESSELEAFLKEAFDAVASGDKQAIGEYLDYNALMGIKDQDATFSDEIYKSMLAGLTIEIISVNPSDDHAMAQVRFSNASLGTALEQYVRKAGELAYNNALEEEPLAEDQLQAEFDKLFLRILKEHSGTTATLAVEVQLVKKDGVWRIQVDNLLRDAVLGGYVTAAGKIGENA